MKLIAGYSREAQSNYSIFVSFPYNQVYVQLIKSLPLRYWHKDTLQWEIPLFLKDNLINLLQQYGITYNKDEFEDSLDIMNSKVAYVSYNVDISELQNYNWPKTTPRDYQLQGISYGLTHPKFLLGDDMGLGKSLQCLNIATLQKIGKHCLIICGYPALKFNWCVEVEKHTNEKAHIIGLTTGKRSKKLKMMSLPERLEDLLAEHEEYFLITDIVTLRYCIKKSYLNRDNELKQKKEYIFAETVNELCQQGIIGRVIMDECQVCKAYSTDNSKALLTIKHCDYKIAATGTPIMNRHIDLYPLMVWLQQESRNYYQFRDLYCVMGGYMHREIKGDRNGDELNARLSKFMLRRRKCDVLNLPPKIRIDEYLQMDLKQQTLYNSIYRKLKASLKEVIYNKNKLLEAMLKLRQVTSLPTWIDPTCKESVKTDRIHFLMEEIVQNGGKAIIFSNWSTPIQELYKEFKEYNPCMIIGDTPDTERMKQVRMFQEDNDCKVILGTVGAMGTGLTLTAANNVIFLDEPWNKALKNQAEDRAHRIGTKSSVNIYTLICKDTFDEIVHKIVLNKGAIADKVVDGSISLELLQEMANSILKS